MAIPLKQGLKLEGYIHQIGESRVDMAIPLKQGLKQQVNMYLEGQTFVDMAIPLKQGLKHKLFTSLSKAFLSLIWQFH